MCDPLFTCFTPLQKSKYPYKPSNSMIELVEYYLKQLANHQRPVCFMCFTQESHIVHIGTMYIEKQFHPKIRVSNE